MALQEELECQVHMIVTSLPFTESARLKFKQAVESEPLFQKLKHLIKNGWPEEIEVLNEHLKPFWNFRELSEHDGLLYKGELVIIPSSYHQEMLS